MATGSQDDSYKGGVKETTECPNETTGSIPNNKSDLLTFHVYEEEGTTPGDPGFLNLAWSRVSDPSGTTLMDFEFNQNSPESPDPADLCPQGPNVQRTDGDLLIEYEIDQGGARANIFGRFWDDTTNTWGPRQTLSSGTGCDGGPCAVGTINNTSALLAADTDGLGNKALRTFGEAQIDLDILGDTGDDCTVFGSGMAKSRSSDADRSQLKDFIAPIGIDIGTCGSVKIIKEDDLGNPLEGAEFTLFTDNDPVGGAPPHGDEDTATDLTCETALVDPTPEDPDSGDEEATCTITDVPAGDYWVVETVTPAGHTTAADQAVTVVADEEITLTFVNPRLLSTLATAPSVIPNDTATVGTDGEDGTYSGTLLFELFDDLAKCQGAEPNAADAVYSESVTVPADTEPGTEFSTDNPGVPSAPGENDGFTINSGNDTTYYWQVTYDDAVRADAVSDCVEATLVTITDDNGGSV